MNSDRLDLPVPLEIYRRRGTLLTPTGRLSLLILSMVLVGSALALSL